MDIDANTVIEKLTQEISQLIFQKTILVVQIEELQKENETLKKKAEDDLITRAKMSERLT